jgi:hypothetical protein
MISRLAIRFLLSALVLAPAVAAADSKGSPGRVASVDVNTAGSDDFSKFRGEVAIRAGSKKVQKMKVERYRFGGSTCPGKDLSEAQLQMLLTAMHERDIVTPRYKNGQGGHRCLVGFSIRAGGGSSKGSK